MVENKHVIGSILSFSAKSVDKDVLEKLLVGREKLVDKLERKVRNIAIDGLNHQVILVGARGTGKTHMLSVLYNRALPLINENKIKIAYFAEEEYGISGYLDFLVRIFNAFIRWNDKDAEFLKEKLSILQQTPSANQENTAERIIRGYIGDQPLLILAENFNEILAFLKKEGQSKLRNWIQENERISIIATSQALSEDIGKEDKPFYGFFEEIDIKPLNLVGSFNLLKSLATLEKQDDVILHLENKGKAQVKAVHELVKGNHRLLITFYSFLKSDTLSNLSVMFIKTLNDLKPYYETYIRYQPPQQQKIIRFLALAKKPQKGVDIARECFIEQKSLSKQLSELSKKKIVDILPNPNDRRNKLYDISEPLLRISIEIGEHREGISALFIDFLALYYDKDELLTQKKKFLDFYKNSENTQEKQDYNYEFLAREKAINLQAKIQTVDIFSLIEKEKYDIAEEKLQENKSIFEEEAYCYLESVIYYKKGLLIEAKETVLKLIQLNDSFAESWVLLGEVLRDLKDYDKAIQAFEKSLKKKKFSRERIVAFEELSRIYLIKEEVKKSNFFIDKAIELEPKNYDNLIIKAHLCQDLEDFEGAESIFNCLLKLNKKDVLVLMGLGHNYLLKGEFDSALKISEKLLKMIPLDLNQAYLLVSLYGIKKSKKQINFLYEMLNLDVISRIEGLTVPFEFILLEIMKKDLEFTEEKYQLIMNSIHNFKEEKELEVVLQFLEAFKEIILHNNEGAFYELPKEQRLFFKKEILDFRAQHTFID